MFTAICLRHVSVAHFTLSTLPTLSGQMLRFLCFKRKTKRDFMWKLSVGLEKVDRKKKTNKKISRSGDVHGEGDLCPPLTSPAPATRAGSCGCCRARWAEAAGARRQSRLGPSPPSPKSFSCTGPRASAGLRYSCGCTRTTPPLTSWEAQKWLFKNNRSDMLDMKNAF